MTSVYTVSASVTLVIIMTIVNTDARRCKWSNENCESKDECCSDVCTKLHEGMNPRCASSALGSPCFSSYQCETGLACSDTYSCCTPFWGVCITQADCCDRNYYCRRDDGFIYKRCLPSRAATKVLRTEYLLISVIVHCYVNILDRLSSH